MVYGTKNWPFPEHSGIRLRVYPTQTGPMLGLEAMLCRTEYPRDDGIGIIIPDKDIPKLIDSLVKHVYHEYFVVPKVKSYSHWGVFE